MTEYVALWLSVFVVLIVVVAFSVVFFRRISRRVVIKDHRDLDEVLFKSEENS